MPLIEVVDATSGAAEEAATGTFTFIPLQTRGLTSFASKEAAAKLSQWGLDKDCLLQRFRFKERFQPAQAEALLLDLLNDPGVQAALSGSKAAPESKARAPSGAFTSVESTPLRVTATSMALFDKLLVRQSRSCCN